MRLNLEIHISSVFFRWKIKYCMRSLLFHLLLNKQTSQMARKQMRNGEEYNFDDSQLITTITHIIPFVCVCVFVCMFCIQFLSEKDVFISCHGHFLFHDDRL